MDERATDILERARLRREMLLKRAQEEGIESFKFSEDPLHTIASSSDHVDANKNAKLAKSKIRRSNSFSDLSQRPVKDRLLSWKNMERKQLENKMQDSANKGHVCGSLTNLSSAVNRGSDAKATSTAQNRSDLQTASLKLELTNQQPKKIFPSYLARDASSNIENKENTQSQRKHYFEPKFGPLTKSKLASPSSTNETEVVRKAKETPGIKKLGPATLVIQDKLSKLCQESWKMNRIAEDIQKKKEDDVKLLTSIWKNGLLCNGDDNKATSSDAHQEDGTMKESFKPEADENRIPPPPPLPRPGEAKNWKNCVASEFSKNGKDELLCDSIEPGLPRAFRPKNCISVVQDLRNPKEVPAKSLMTLKGGVKNVNFIDNETSTAKLSIRKVTSETDKKANVGSKKGYDCHVDEPSSSSESKLSLPSSGNIPNKVQPKVEIDKFNRFPKPFSKLHLEKKFAPVKVESPVAMDNSIASVDSFTENLANDFEKNLKAMGYRVEKGKGKEVVVELESAPETEEHSNLPKIGRSDFILRPRQVTTNRPRVQSHVEESVTNSGGGRKTNINKVNASNNSRPISMVESKKVATNFNKHDVITVMKKKVVKIDTCAINLDANGLSKTQRETNFRDKHVQGKIFNKTRKSEMDVRHSSVRNNPTVELVDRKVCNDDVDEDTYGLEDGDLSRASSSSSDPTTNMETYFSVTEMQADQKKFNSDDVYVQMDGNQNQRSNSSSDEFGECCYAATEEDSDVYEEIRDSSPASKANCRRHVSMRRAFKSHFSDEDVNDTVASEDEKDALLRRKVESKVQRARPFTTNASFDPPGYSSPLPYSLPSNEQADNFKGLCRNIALNDDCSRSKKYHASGQRRAKKRSSQFKSEEFLAPPGTLARLAASSHGRQQNVMKHHLDQFLERRGFFRPSSRDGRESATQNSDKIRPQPTVPAKSAKVKIQSLEELIEQEEKFSIQASNALNICVKKSHLWTDEAVECHRILLAAAKRKEILSNELKRLRERRNVVDSSLSTGAPVVGKLMITGVRLPLKPEFIAKSGTLTDTTVTYFVMTIQSGESMSSSQTFSTKDQIVLGSLEVPGQLALAGVPMQFSALLEVYALIVPRDMKSSSSKKAHAVRKATESASKKPNGHRTEDERNVVSGLGSSYFVPVGRLELDERLINKGHFPLEGVRYPSPLQGSVHLRMKYLPETDVHFRGYLNVCPEGSREFVRKWCCLTRSEINLWRNASEELIKEPFIQIDLKSCIMEQLVPVAINYSLQKDTFEITTVTQLEPVAGRMKERMTEKSGTPVKLQQIRCWFSADSAEECSSWCHLINRNLVELRTWHPYAIPCIKFKHPQVSPFTFDSLL